jgi:outer membrane protein OmpA-like peptidoglycan-associated protein
MMKTTQFTPVLLVIATLLGACNSMPKTTGLLDQTRNDYRVVQSNPQVGNYAALEMKQASEAMAKANQAADENESTEDIDKLAYLAKQKIALTQEVIKRKTAEAEVASSAKERDQVRLDQRTMEADQATAEKRQAQGNAAFAERQTREAQARAAQLEAQLAALSAKTTERGMVITLSDVLFQTDRARLNQNGLGTLQKLADLLQQHGQRTVLIEGFTDSTGSAAHNQKLSERRAMSVRRSLQDMGISRDRIAIRGFGESYPVASNETAEDRQLNRRVEIILSNEDGVIRQR